MKRMFPLVVMLLCFMWVMPAIAGPKCNKQKETIMKAEGPAPNVLVLFQAAELVDVITVGIVHDVDRGFSKCLLLIAIMENRVESTSKADLFHVATSSKLNTVLQFPRNREPATLLLFRPLRC